MGKTLSFATTHGRHYGGVAVDGEGEPPVVHQAAVVVLDAKGRRLAEAHLAEKLLHTCLPIFFCSTIHVIFGFFLLTLPGEMNWVLIWT